MKTLLACLVASCLLAGNAFAQSPAQPVDRIAAVVNEWAATNRAGGGTGSDSSNPLGDSGAHVRKRIG